jgi:hypothetical protein
VHFGAVVRTVRRGAAGGQSGVRRPAEVAHVEIDMDANPVAARPTFGAPPRRHLAPTAASGTAPRPHAADLRRRWNRCWLDHHVIG